MTCCSRGAPTARRALALSVTLGWLASPALAQQVPLGQPSAIPVADEPITVAPTPGLRAPDGFGVPIDGTSLDAPSAEAAGLLGTQALGLPADMWTGSTAADALAAVRGVEPTWLWRVNALLRRTLVAGALPPEGADGLLAERAAALLRFGAAEDAAKLTGAAGNIDADALRRASAEADLLIGREKEVCDRLALLKGEDVDGFLATLRGYCLARAGDPLAPVAVAAMRELGRVDPLDAELLEAIVDESLREYVATPPAQELTPIRIAMLRRLGRSVSTMADQAPLKMLAGLYALESTSPDAAVKAAERLEAAGSIPTRTLVELYALHVDDLNDPVLRERAATVSEMLEQPDARRIGAALLKAARERGPQAFARMARLLAPVAATLPASDAGGLGPEGYAIRDALLLSGKIAQAGRWSDAQGPKPPADEADSAALLAIADRNWPGGWRREWGDALRDRARQGDENARRALGALAGFGIGPGPELPSEGYLGAAREGRVAEAIFGVASALNAEKPPSARTLDTTIRALRDAGLEADARAVAIEAMLLGRWM